ncbi:MAG: hypothetical protein RLZZ165_817 [Bacteroidota bacterium]
MGSKIGCRILRWIQGLPMNPRPMPLKCGREARPSFPRPESALSAAAGREIVTLMWLKWERSGSV